MKKNIYTGIFCTILGLCISTPANASIISRGFLDQALTDYATTTALDLKADKADLTDLSDKIGTLPTFRISSFTIGEQNAEIMDFLETKNLPVTYPSTLGRFMNEMYEFYLHTMFAGWTDTTGKEYGGLIDLNNRIGTLPDGYETVGAALSAIKGIAEEAKAAALAAIPDPKQEGSSGKFVLTVDIVGNNATYRWEPIDRGDTTSTTE